MRQFIDIIFIILHYNTIDETCNCVESIKNKINADNFHIFIVDNCSPNNSGSVLFKKYMMDNMITVIKTNCNLGFANGNNFGIQYAREKYDCDFICCLNNDTLIEQDDFLDNIKREYKISGAAVIGPRITLKNGETQNFDSRILTIETYEDFLKGLRKENLFQNIKIKVRNSFIGLKIIRLKKFIYRKEMNPNKSKENVLLHGCCLIFTPIFFEFLNGFDNRTFLYREEELLFLAVKKAGLTLKYAPSIQIKHLEDAATNSISKSKKERKDFQRKNLIKSTEILIKTLKEY